MERKRKRENINDLYTKHNSNELKYKNKRIFRNKLKYLEKEKTNLYNILPNVKSTTKTMKKKAPPKHEEIQITRIDFDEMCEKCNIFLKIILQESILSCPCCGTSKPIPLYSISAAESDFFVPKALQNKARIIDWLQNVQGNDSGTVKQDIAEELCAFIYKHKKNKVCDYVKTISEEFIAGGPFTSHDNAIKRLKSKIPGISLYLKEINHSFIRQCLEEMKTNYFLMDGEDKGSKFKRCYEKAPKYASALSGLNPLCFTSEQEEKIKYLYSLASPEYERHKGKYKNWPGGYAYFLRCVCALLGYDEFLDHFDHYSSNNKIKEEREIFRKKVWGHLKWEYFNMDHPLPKIIQN